MTREEFDEITVICEREYLSAVIKLKEGELSILDTQYHLGRKHAAKNILTQIEHIERGDEQNN